MQDNLILSVPQRKEQEYVFFESDLLFIKNEGPKKKPVPVMYTKKGIFTNGFSLESLASGLSGFDFAQPWHLVNLSLIDEIVTESYGHMISFRNIKERISMSHSKYDTINLVGLNKEDRQAIVVNPDSKHGLQLPLNDVSYIELSQNGQRIPCFITHHGLYESASSLRQYKDAFPFLTQIDSGILANTANIKLLEITQHGRTVHYHDSSFTSTMGRTMANHFKKIIPTIKT